jgi:hypothetical protein
MAVKIIILYSNTQQDANNVDNDNQLPEEGKETNCRKR